MGLTPLAPSGWCLFGIWLLPLLSLSLILGPSSASHSCAEDGSFLWISGSQLTHEDGTQNFSNTRTHTFRALSNHPWLQRNSLLFKHHCPAWICSSLLLETSLQSWMGVRFLLEGCHHKHVPAQSFPHTPSAPCTWLPLLLQLPGLVCAALSASPSPPCIHQEPSSAPCLASIN